MNKLNEEFCNVNELWKGVTNNTNNTNNNYTKFYINNSKFLQEVYYNKNNNIDNDSPNTYSYTTKKQLPRLNITITQMQ